jgi:hypothetical protein
MKQQDRIDKDLHKLARSIRKESSPAGSIDGYDRHPDAEDRLNELAHAVFGSFAGQQFLNYLRQITLNAPLGPDASDQALRHKEGQRHLFGIIHKRYEKGKDDAR